MTCLWKLLLSSVGRVGCVLNRSQLGIIGAFVVIVSAVRPYRPLSGLNGGQTSCNISTLRHSIGEA